MVAVSIIVGAWVIGAYVGAGLEVIAKAIERAAAPTTGEQG